MVILPYLYDCADISNIRKYENIFLKKLYSNKNISNIEIVDNYLFFKICHITSDTDILNIKEYKIKMNSDDYFFIRKKSFSKKYKFNNETIIFSSKFNYYKFDQVDELIEHIEKEGV